jgi:mercuric ion binding protein
MYYLKQRTVFNKDHFSNLSVVTTILSAMILLTLPSFAADQGEIIVSVPGIPGPYCAYGIEKRLLELDGIQEVHLFWNEEEIRSVIRTGKKVSTREIKEAVRRADYPYKYSIKVRP